MYCEGHWFCVVGPGCGCDWQFGCVDTIVNKGPPRQVALGIFFSIVCLGFLCAVVEQSLLGALLKLISKNATSITQC